MFIANAGPFAEVRAFWRGNLSAGKAAQREPISLLTPTEADRFMMRPARFGRKLFPKIAPYETLTFPVSDGHVLYVERAGRPAGKGGKPIVFLHGGPGQGCDENDRRYFDPHFFDATLFNQRGVAPSTPDGNLDGKENNTAKLIEDMEAIREKFYGKDGKWAVYGISWGATLGLAYAIAHPDKVSGLVLRGLTVDTHEGVDWLFKKGGCSRFFPEAWAQFEGHIPVAERHNLLEAYDKRLMDADPKVHMPAATAWNRWASSHYKLHINMSTVPEANAHDLQMARMECRYFRHQCYLPADALMKDLDKLKDVPLWVVQGRYDMISPPDNAYRIQQALGNRPNVKVAIVEKSGHSTSDPAVQNAELAALDDLKETLSGH